MKNYQQLKRIAQLIAGEAIGVLDQTELDELESWMNQHPENRVVYHRIKNSSRFKDWKAEYDSKSAEKDWEKFYKSLQRQKFQYQIRTGFKYAAILVFSLLIAGGSYFLILKTSENNKAEQLAQLIKPGSSKAILTLNNGKAIVLDTPEKLLLKENDGTTIQKTQGAVSYSSQLSGNNEEIIYNSISIPRGGEYVLVLSDGTKVYLNSLTTLKYPVSFPGKVREVELTGEAYFEVAPDKTKPFIVKTRDLRTVDLGTVFNINAYEKSEKIATTLVEGKVRIESADKNQVQILNPDEQAVFDNSSNSFTVNKVDVKLYTAWKDGEFIFRNERLSDIMKTLTRWYSSDFEFQDPSLEALQFSGSLNRYGDIQPILDIIKSTGKVEIEINQNNIVFKKKK